jgi:uncharacterized iron-regulated protein
MIPQNLLKLIGFATSPVCLLERITTFCNSGIGSYQKPNIVALEALYKDYNETLYTYLTQIKESKTCLETIQTWCDAVSFLYVG